MHNFPDRPIDSPYHHLSTKLLHLVRRKKVWLKNNDELRIIDPFEAIITSISNLQSKMVAMLPEIVIKWITDTLKLDDLNILQLKRHGTHALKGE